MNVVELRNLAAKLRTIWANPQDNVFIYKAADELEKLTQQVAVPKVTIELPDGDERIVKTWFTEVRNGEIFVSISVDKDTDQVTESYELPDWKLLSLASKAVGYTRLPIEGWTIDKVKGMRLVDSDNEFIRYWNPLIDDGDALRLAAALEMDISLAECGATVDCRDVTRADIGDPYSAARRAIVIAAAEIGKNNE